MPATYANLKPERLHTTDDDFEAIWQVLGKAKDGTDTLRVNHKALLHVMMDHSLFHAQVFPNIASIQNKGR
jgi:hypothetical protein